MRHSIDILRTARPVMALQDEYPAGYIDPMHSHDHVQILCLGRVMSVRTPETSFVIPPQRAVWLPAGMRHEVACRGPVSLRTLYLPSDAGALTAECRVFEVSNLLKSLILEVVDFPRSMTLPVARAASSNCCSKKSSVCPMPPIRCRCPATRGCFAFVMRLSPTRPIRATSTIGPVSRQWGAGRSRAFKQETGMSLAVWRQQVRLMEALSMLAAGMSITRVTYDVGYDSPSGFCRDVSPGAGVPPSQYLKQ
jgi:hypothetical protein